jgi:hypothetical protein
MQEGKHYHRSMNELDCLIDFDLIEKEMAGGNLTAPEAREGARSEFIQSCLETIEKEEEDALDYIEKEKGVSKIIEGLPLNQDEQDNRSL